MDSNSKSANMKEKILEFVKESMPMDSRAKINCQISFKFEDNSTNSEEVIEITEELVKMSPNKSQDMSSSLKSNKRKSMAPQKMIPTGDDSFILASNSSKMSIKSGSTMDLTNSFNDQEVPLNLSRNSSPQDFQSDDQVETSTPLKNNNRAAAFQLNNPTAATNNVFPTFPITFPLWTPYNHFLQQYPALSRQHSNNLQGGRSNKDAIILPKPENHHNDQSMINNGPSPAKIKKVVHEKISPESLGLSKPAATHISARANATTGLVPIRTPGTRKGPHKTFPCNQCEQNFNTLTLLSKHTYEEHKGYKCTFCGANFTQRSNLQRHSLKHVGFKPFECRVCKKSYYRKDHLVRHIEVTHPGNEPKMNIDTKLSSAECLEYLEKMQTSGVGELVLNTDQSSPNSPFDDEEEDDHCRLKIIAPVNEDDDSDIKQSPDSIDCSDMKMYQQEDEDVDVESSDFQDVSMADGVLVAALD